MRRLILFLLFFVMIGAVHAQFTYGTTGLLNMPTADMQRDKTFMFGGGFLEKHATPARWTYNTFNYYLDITIFPWLEVSYICTLHKAMEVDPAYGSGFWVPSTYGKFVNQDRNFAVRLRLWKEGWWKPWTPQIVLGANDALNNSWTEGSKIEMSSATANGFYSRYYLVALAALLFGLFRSLSNVYTGFDFLAQLNLPSTFYNMLPYIISLLVLALTSSKSRAPKAEGIPYDKGSR